MSSVGHSAGKDAIKSVFGTIYGFPLAEAERRWHTDLRDRER
jgi:hypothetical protein